MNKDFIKWLVSFAEGFEWNQFGYGIHLNNIVEVISINDFLSNKKWFLYSLLFQKAIEGINKGETFLIYQDFSEIRIEHNVNDNFELYFVFNEYSVDEAKEEALKYIWEQEK